MFTDDDDDDDDETVKKILEWSISSKNKIHQAQMEGRKAFVRRTKDAMLWLSMRIDDRIRSFKRDPDENVNGLIGRLRKKIGKDKEDIDVEFMRDEKSVLKLDGLSTRSALSRTKFIHVRRKRRRKDGTFLDRFESASRRRSEHVAERCSELEHDTCNQGRKL